MGCNCGKPKCDGHCGVSPAVLQINNPSECVLFRKVEVPASMGTSVENPPKPGAYRNVLLYYNADGEAYLYSSDGMPTKVTGTTSNYEILTNKPKINGVELVGDKSLADIGVTDAIDNALENYTPTSGFAEVAFTGDYEDLVNTPPKVVSHFYTLSLDLYDIGDEVPIYNDEGMTDRTTYEQFADAIVKGPVQFNQQYDVGSYNIREIYLVTAEIEYDIGFSVEDTPGGNQRTEMLWNKGDSMPVIEYIRPSYTQVNADWNTTNTSSPAYIKNKPALAAVATSGSYDDLTDKPDIPSGLHVFHMGPASVGNTAPIYHDYEKTNQVTLAQFIDAIASGPVQIYKAYDTRSFLIYYVDPIDAFIPDSPQYTGTLYANFGLRDPYGLGVKRFSWYEPDTAPTYDSYDANQSDWNETSPTNSSYILNKPSLATVATSGSYNDLSNKPTIPAAQVNSDWNASSGVAQILNKPTLAAVATSGNYNDLSNKPTIPAAQVNSDWNAASGVAQILNKPSLATVATSGSYNDLTDKPADFELVEMSYGESNAWAKFIAAYQGHKIVYCRVSSNADPSTGTQGRKAFMAYVNNAENPTEVEFQYVRSVASKTASQPVDQVFVYKLTSANGGTWTVETRNMAPKLTAGTNATVSYSNGTYTVGATVPTKTSDLTNDGATGTSVYIEESDIAPSELSGEGELITLNGTTDCSILDTQLLGNAEQTTYSGKNLLNINATPTLSYATVSVSGQSITVTTDNQAKTTRATLPMVYEANREMTVSFDATCLAYEPTATNTVIVYMRTTGQSDATTQISLNKTVGTTVHYTKTFTPDNNTKDLWFYLKSSPVAGVVSYRFDNVQVEYGASETSYEPFVGEIPAPNPQFPQPISTVTGEQNIEVVGKNLFDMDDFLTAAEATYTKDGGQYSITAWGNLISIRYPLQSVKIGNTYTISLDGVAQSTASTRLQVYKNGSVVGTIYGGTDHQEHSYTFTADGSQYELNATYSSPFSSPVIFKNPQLELGSATTYEPYQGQNYEVNLGKNLVDVDSLATTGVTVADGVMTGTATNIYNAYGQNTTGLPFIKKDGQLSVSLKAYTDGDVSTTNNEGIRIRATYTDGTNGTLLSFNNNQTTATAKSATTAAGKNVEYIQITYVNTGGNTWHISELQIEQSAQPTAYASYFTPIELAKVGNYQDRIYKDEGKWYVEKQIKKYVFDGSENWTLYPSKLHTFRTGLGEDRALDGICDHFVKGLASAFDVTPCFYASNTGVAIFSYPDMADVSAWTTWLGTHNTTVYYVLETPTTTEITNETLIGQLEALAGALGYDGVTNIISTSPGLPAILSVSTYTGSAIPSATRARAGIVRIGDGIDVDDCGTISVNAQKAPTAFTMQYADNLAGWQSGDNYELVKETTGSPTDYIYRANKFYYGGTGVSFLNEKTGVVFTPQELYAWLLDGNEAVLNHVPLGWAVDNGAEVLHAGNYIDGIWLKRETIASQSGNMISFNGSAFVTALIPRTSSYEETVQDTLGIAISGYEEDGAMVYDLISIDGFSLYGSVQESSPII